MVVPLGRALRRATDFLRSGAPTNNTPMVFVLDRPVAERRDGTDAT